MQKLILSVLPFVTLATKQNLSEVLNVATGEWESAGADVEDVKVAETEE